jgi:hypothetical protein
MVEIGGGDPLDFLQLPLGKLAQARQQAHDRDVIAEPVVDVLAVAPGSSETGAPQYLQVLRGVGDREAAPSGDDLDRPFTLRQPLQNQEAVLMAECPCDRADGGEERKGRRGLTRRWHGIIQAID